MSRWKSHPHPFLPFIKGRSRGGFWFKLGLKYNRSMGLEKDNIKHIADLAKLELSPEEAQRLPKDLADILAYVESLQKLKIDDMPDTGQITGLTNQLACDEIVEEYSREELLKNLPPNRQDKGFIKVKSVLGRET